VSGLILIPTPLELDILQRELRSAADEYGWSIELCGFGPIASASQSASLIEQKKPNQVLLLGIAGAFADAVPLGSATSFDRVCCYGVGVGSGEQYQSASEAGFKHWNHDGVSIDDWLDLQARSAETINQRLLLTSPAASANKSEATQKLTVWPSAIAEDMEGFSVAVSCTLAGVPLAIIRGISNEVGDRHRKNWQIDAALGAAAKLAIKDVLTRPLA
jgi:futalosine hydrolase